MDTKINEYVLSNWGDEINTNGTDATSSLSEFKTLVNSLPKAYDNLSSEAIINNMISDLTNLSNTHSSMANLQDYLEKVVENAKE